MKKRTLIFLSIIVFSGFSLLSFASLDLKKTTGTDTVSKIEIHEPIGGFVSSDKL